MNSDFGFKSVAIWPDVIDLANENNSSSDMHYTYAEAEIVCDRLEEQGFGGKGKVFPVVTWVESPDEYTVTVPITVRHDSSETEVALGIGEYIKTQFNKGPISITDKKQTAEAYLVSVNNTHTYWASLKGLKATLYLPKDLKVKKVRLDIKSSGGDVTPESMKFSLVVAK